MYTPYPPQNMNTCPELKEKCIYSLDAADYERADMIVVYARDNFNMMDPMKRHLKQKWVYSTIESPMHSYTDLLVRRWFRIVVHCIVVHI